MSVAVLVYAGMLELELGAALSVFSLAGGAGAARTVARTRASVLGAGGLVTTPEVMFAALEPPQAVFVPGGPGAAKLGRDPLVKGFLAAQRARGVPVGASGGGVLALGEAGLLAARTVVAGADLEGMVWAYGPAEVRAQGLAEDKGVLTALGGLFALDVALRLAAAVWGEEAARQAARRLGR